MAQAYLVPRVIPELKGKHGPASEFVIGTLVAGILDAANVLDRSPAALSLLADAGTFAAQVHKPMAQGREAVAQGIVERFRAIEAAGLVDRWQEIAHIWAGKNWREKWAINLDGFKRFLGDYVAADLV